VQFLRGLTTAEWVCAWGTQLAFWHASPPIRDRWVWLLLLPVLFWSVRWLVTRRAALPPVLAVITLSFLALSAYNYEAAPLRRADYWVLVCRPLAGLWLIAATVQLVWHEQRLRWPLAALGALAVVGLTLGLFATQWSSKSAALDPITRALPRLDHRAFLPDAQLSFNPNEIAGALALLCPLMFGLAYRQRGRVRWALAAVGVGLLEALLLGQSRFALAGVIVSLGVWVFFSLHGGARRTGVLALAALIALEAAIVSAVPRGDSGSNGASPLAQRDIDSLQHRVDMIERSLQMLIDHPLTGVGMSMYRTAIRQPAYQIPAFEAQNFTAPHAHNLWAQMAADMGIPGLLWYGTLHAWFVWMLRRIAQRGDRGLAAALGAAFLSYSIYGLGDAITLWDRLGFVWWALFAAAAAGCDVQNIGYNTSVEASLGEKRAVSEADVSINTQASASLGHDRAACWSCTAPQQRPTNAV